MNQTLSKYAFRFFISLIISLIFGFLVSEGSFFILNQGEDFSNEDIVLTIPNGTAERIKNGLSVPSIPANIVFYQGDRIVVNNEDVVSHQLGPIWVPAGAQGVLTLQGTEKYSIACTFKPQKIMGIEVRNSVTNLVRFQGLLAVGLPSGVMLFLFSIILFPIDNDLKNNEP
ncbi:MAG: hypothetical protein ACYDH1_08780 [Anaerolineaceae bacterium]|jgi:hypothetical protein|nr:MAG: hypothetical protein CVU46_11515 [Chloroflexi bacterium HGW-Chloroflexi-8]